MSNPPRIWLDYRPVRIGWVAEARDVAQLATAASWSTCLWGGLFNPIIPIEDRDFSDKLIRAFGVDVLIPVAASNATTAFVDAYPHLHLRMWSGGVFKDRRSEVVDIRHAVRRVAGARAPLDLSAFVRPVWLPDDPMSAMLSALFGRYPSPEEITLNYVAVHRVRYFLAPRVARLARSGDRSR